VSDSKALARLALTAFRDGFAGQLAEAGALTQPLNPHVVGYKTSAHPPFGARLIAGEHTTGKFTTVDFVWSSRARFWISVGSTKAGEPAIMVSRTGFGVTEGFGPEVAVLGGDVSRAALELGRLAAQRILAEHYGHFGWR
jgi:hypothetical protein